ncbi:MAG: flagellin [Burkholderiaceae bacterium]
MSMTINTNIVSLNAQRNMSTSQSALATSMQRLSSGLRVNSAKDDAAGLAIAERMSAQVRGSNVAMRNANDAISLFQTAEGAMSKIGDSLQRIRELAVQAANGSISDADRTNLNAEATQLVAEIARVSDNAKFNGVNLLDGSLTTADFQVGADATDVITTTTSFDMTALAAYAAADISTQAGATAVLTATDTDLDTLNTARADAGALQGRFEAVVGQLQVYAENVSSARGRIMDADFAQETASLSRAQILQQAGSAMVAQANQLPNLVMALLR